MGEVVEISMIGKSLNVYEELLCFLTSYINEDCFIHSIKAMDNWKYDNIVILSSLSDANKLVQDKIISVDVKTSNNYLGVSVEKKKDEFYIEGWINSKVEIAGQDYKRFLNRFVDVFKHNKSVKLCGIGKEIFVDYNLDINQVIEKSHNIDLWMVCCDKYYALESKKTKVICIQ